jgi:outer membrane receptor protein involved in Fe transport
MNETAIATMQLGSPKFDLSPMQRARLLLLVASCLIAILPGIAAADLSSTARFDIPAQPLQSAVVRFTQQAGIQVTSAGETLRGRRSAPVSGQLTAEAALTQLLSGTALDWRAVDANTVVIYLSAAPTAALPAANEGIDDTSFDSTPLEVVVVTARKREESLQSAPLSIQAMSGKELTRRRVVGLRELSGALSGINLVVGDPGKANVSIRGITSVTATPTTGFYLDDVAISGRQAYNGQSEPAMLDLQRVEVLRGPQGTLYGAGAMGGAIKFVSNRPDAATATLDVTAGTAAIDGGELGYDTGIVANVPLIDNVLALRMAGSYSYEGGYVDRIADGRGLLTNVAGGEFQSFNETTRDNVNSQRRAAGRVALSFEPDDSWSMLLDLRYQQFEAPAPESYWPNLPRFEQSTVVAEPIDDSMALPMLTVARRLGAVNLTSITSYLERKRDETLDYTFYVGSLVPDWADQPSDIVIPTRSRSAQQELRLSSADPDARTQFVAGAYWQHEDFSYDQTVVTVGSGVTSSGVANDVVYYKDFGTRVKQLAIFGDLTWSLTDRVGVVVGGRGFRIETDLRQSQDGFFSDGASQLRGATRESGFTPKFQVTTKLDQDHLLYALVSKGFRQGDVNPPVPLALCEAELAALGYTTPPASIDSDSLWNYEVGTKNTFADRNVMLNVSGYFLDWKDIQQSVIMPSCGFGFSANVAAAEVKGAELEMRWAPLRGLTFSAAATYNDARITQSAPGVQARVGDRVQIAPEWVANGSVEYTFKLLERWPLYARADYQWHDSQTLNFVDTMVVDADPYTGVDFGEQRTVLNPGHIQQSYRQLNLSLGLDAEDWSLRLFVDNVTNEQPILGLTNVASGWLQTTAYSLRPRTLGLSVTRRLQLR